MFDLYKNRKFGLWITAQTINEALTYKKTVNNNINITQEMLIEIKMKNNKIFPFNFV